VKSAIVFSFDDRWLRPLSRLPDLRQVAAGPQCPVLSHTGCRFHLTNAPDAVIGISIRDEVIDRQ
jgi:hypothetical protein